MARSRAGGWRSSGSRGAIPGAGSGPTPSPDQSRTNGISHVNDDNRNFIAVRGARGADPVRLAVARAANSSRAANPPVTKIESGKTKVVKRRPPPPRTTAGQGARPATSSWPKRPRMRDRAPPTLKGSINLKGARIDDLVLTDYKETIAKNSPPIRLLSPRGTHERLFRAASAGTATASPSPMATRSSPPAAMR